MLTARQKQIIANETEVTTNSCRRLAFVDAFAPEQIGRMAASGKGFPLRDLTPQQACLFWQLNDRKLFAYDLRKANEIRIGFCRTKSINIRPPSRGGESLGIYDYTAGGLLVRDAFLGAVTPSPLPPRKQTLARTIDWSDCNPGRAAGLLILQTYNPALHVMYRRLILSVTKKLTRLGEPARGVPFLASDFASPFSDAKAYRVNTLDKTQKQWLRRFITVNTEETTDTKNIPLDRAEIVLRDTLWLSGFVGGSPNGRFGFNDRID